MRLKKSNDLRDGRLLFTYWANNKGRGNNNCTLVIVPTGTTREATSKPHCINQTWLGDGENCTRTSSWAGNVNMSKFVCEKLGIKKEDILI